MNEHQAPAVLPTHDSVRHRLPQVFRIQSIARLPFDTRCVMNRAVLFHDRACLTVEWLSRQVDVRLVVGAQVSIRWCGRPVSESGAVRVSRIVLLERPEADLNPFETIPTVWVTDRALVRRAAFLWECLPRGLSHLFNAVFWSGERLYRYLTGPSSIAAHTERYGNLRHCVEVAERALDLATRESEVHLGVLIMAALLHDAGKAEEYRQGFRCLELTARGKLIGHRTTVLEWVAAARERHRVIVPETHYLGLIHALASIEGAPAWSGLREPKSAEAILLGAADRLSAARQTTARRDGPGFDFTHTQPNTAPRRYLQATST